MTRHARRSHSKLRDEVHDHVDDCRAGGPMAGLPANSLSGDYWRAPGHYRKWKNNNGASRNPKNEAAR